jgi:hypothetical protein
MKDAAEKIYLRSEFFCGFKLKIGGSGRLRNFANNSTVYYKTQIFMKIKKYIRLKKEIKVQRE